MWRRLFSSQHHQTLILLSTSNLMKISSEANHILVSRQTRTRFSRVFSSYFWPNVRVEGSNPTETGQDSDGIEAVKVMNSVPNGQRIALDNADDNVLTRGEQKKLLKQRQYEVRKAEIIAADKERRRIEGERKMKAWDEKLASVGEEERMKLIEERRGLRMDTLSKKNEEKVEKIERLKKGREHGQNIVIDLEFLHLMSHRDIKSLRQQIIFSYAANGRCSSPSHLWLTACRGDMETHLLQIPGYENWIIEKESRSYIEAFKDRKDDLVYLTPDSETILDDIDSKKVYIVGGLVDRTMQKGVTMKKARSQRIQTAKLPIREFLKGSTCQVLAINQVLELLLKFNETKDWKTSFCHAVPQRKQSRI
ncbi:unnamed protein product [Rhodiola kirilowii]